MSFRDKCISYDDSYISDILTSLNSEEITELIEMLQKTKQDIIKKEREEKKIAEEKRKAEEERKRAEEDHVKNITSMELPLDWSNVYDLDEKTSEIHAESAGDGLIYSLKNLGRVDIEYISKITGIEIKDVIKKLKNSIYQDPDCLTNNFYEGYKIADEYLSGNLFNKLKKAEEANKKYHGHFQNNIDALKKIMPAGVMTEDIYYTIASPWIPHSLIEDFIVSTFGVSRPIVMNNVKYDSITGTWELKIESYYTNFKSDLTYGTSKIRSIKLLERILNCKSMSIYDTLTTPTGKKRILNKEETLLAEQKANEIQDAFVSFIDSNYKRKDLITKAYNERYGYNVSRTYVGNFLKFPNLNSNIQLFDYQKDAVARIIFNKNTLLAHNVGAGKTYVMISAGEELIRTKLSNKNLYVVPNNIVLQWANIYKQMYPESKVLVTKTSDYTPKKRRETLEKIKNGDYKNIIIPYSSFDRIPLSTNIEISKLNNLINKINLIDFDKRTKALNKLNDSLIERLKELNNIPINLDDDITFDKLGIERLFIDEAHNYKNIPIITKMGNIKGVNPQGSTKCIHMLDVVDYMNSKGYGTIMATGTPITNSISDAYTFQRYLQNGELQLVDINTFDAWVAMFAENAEELEVDVDTSAYRVTTRFSKFHNLPELAQLMSSIADFYYEKQSTDLPIFNGYTNIMIKKTIDLSDYLIEISKRVEDIRNGLVLRTDDNMLKVTTDGRKAALDLRLVNPYKYANLYGGKVSNCAENIVNIYLKTREFKGTQLVFCDISTPKSGFNIYDELKGKLVAFGIHENEIEYIHEASTDKEREKILDDTRKGTIRVLIGSTFKLGTGVNIQERLYAIHHLDVPWRPADMVQREGRILRQGNTNPEVFIYRYIQEGSFDAYSWQLLETKQNFINELLSNSLNERTKEDVQDTILSYGEVKALAIGNPLLKTHVDLKNQLNTYSLLQKRQTAKESNLKTRLLSIPNKRKNLKELIYNLKLDIELYKNNKREYNEKERLEFRKKYWFGMVDNLRSEKATDLGLYKGFNVIVPAYLLENSLSLELQGNGVNTVLIGNSELGVMVRIDNVLEGLPDKLSKKEKELANLNEEEKSIQIELDKKFDYSNQISELKKQIDQIEKKLKI